MSVVELDTGAWEGCLGTANIRPLLLHRCETTSMLHIMSDAAML